MNLFSEIAEQPAALRETISALALSLPGLTPYASKLRTKSITQVIFTGMGGSFGAAYACLGAFAEAHIRAYAVEAAALLYEQFGLLDSQTLIIVISQSGETVEIVKLLERVNGLDTAQRPSVVGITNVPQSSLSREADHVLVIQAGIELSVANKTYTCTLAALHLLTAILTGADVKEAILRVERAADTLDLMLTVWQDSMRDLAEQIKGRSLLVCLGRGSSRAAAVVGALMLQETAKMPSEGMLGGQFRHGPLEVLSQNIEVLMFSGEGCDMRLNQSLALDVIGKGGHITWIGEQAEAPLINLLKRRIALKPIKGALLSIVEIVPIQMLAAYLAALRGFVPGRLLISSKVIKVE